MYRNKNKICKNTVYYYYYYYYYYFHSMAIHPDKPWSAGSFSATCSRLWPLETLAEQRFYALDVLTATKPSVLKHSLEHDALNQPVAWPLPFFIHQGNWLGRANLHSSCMGRNGGLPPSPALLFRLSGLCFVEFVTNLVIGIVSLDDSDWLRVADWCKRYQYDT